MRCWLAQANAAWILLSEYLKNSSRCGIACLSLGLQENHGKICKITVVSWKNWKNHGKITAFSYISKSSIKESCYVHCIYEGSKCHEKWPNCRKQIGTKSHVDYELISVWALAQNAAVNRRAKSGRQRSSTVGALQIQDLKMGDQMSGPDIWSFIFRSCIFWSCIFSAPLYCTDLYVIRRTAIARNHGKRSNLSP